MYAREREPSRGSLVVSHSRPGEAKRSGCRLLTAADPRLIFGWLFPGVSPALAHTMIRLGMILLFIRSAFVGVRLGCCEIVVAASREQNIDGHGRLLYLG